ncbi:nuclear transport factor 2 family protein [Sphingobium phenoxybenzoativorans]|uniref:nuclear transport factor 2 family protein n=1 Tax=Sphingobium phenoxybenzoativorans TaxID=1592790 RepID=UPI000873464E|nr:nuclear transport factor 2 family protein [Sphingobium phenoxybenzoativorans]
MSMHPGTTSAQSSFVEDRLAIVNLFAAYAHFANVGDIDGWANCFTSDATYAVSAPRAPGIPLPIAQVVAAETPQFAAYRRMLDDPDSGERKIYCIVNPYVVTQDASSASIVCELVQLRAQPTGPAPRIQLTGTYSGDLVKRDGEWRIFRWAISTTRQPESVSEVPALWWLNVAASKDGDWRAPAEQA